VGSVTRFIQLSSGMQMFTKDSRTEVFLTQMGVEFRYTNNVAFSDLAPGWDCKNLARPSAKREDAILEYATLMESGSPAPAPILHQAEKYNVLDGIQRLCAAQLGGATKVSAYIVLSDSDELLDAIRVLANIRLQGRQEPPEWTRRRAVEILVIQRGMSHAEVARLGGWTPADIKRLAESMDLGFAIRCIGGPLFPDSIIETIGKHATKDLLPKYRTPIAAFFDTIKEGRFSAQDAEPLIQEFFAPSAKPSNAVYEQRLNEIKQAPEVEIRLKGRRSTRLSPDVNLRRALRAVETIVDEMKEPPLYVDEFFRLLNVIERRLRTLSKHSPAPDAPRTPADKWSSHEQD
jgi:hypothetical protein